MAKSKYPKEVPFTEDEERNLVGYGCEIDTDEAEFTVNGIELTVKKVQTGKNEYKYELNNGYAYFTFECLIADIQEPLNDDGTSKFDPE